MIDDVRGVTLASMNDMNFKGPRSSRALQLGESFGRIVSKLGIDRGVFDRSWYKYHGLIKIFCENFRKFCKV